ncbi:MAG: glutamine amidotransferase class-I [Bacteroidota bacterium]|jgi:GMP synthase (glutamine-hydrolysing)|nr:glutamine amidotransferase class-I [Bacteroidota bacterium]
MICIIDFGSPKIPDIVESLAKLGRTFRVVPWENSHMIEKERATALILSGSPLLIGNTDIEPHIKRYEFIKTTSLPVLGICYGHQFLGVIHGSDHFKGEEIRKLTEIKIIEKDHLFKGFENSVIMKEDHTEGITLPPGFIHLASSDKYEVEAMKHPEKNIYGVQFHPEVSGDNGMQLLTNFCELI